MAAYVIPWADGTGETYVTFSPSDTEAQLARALAAIEAIRVQHECSTEPDVAFDNITEILAEFS